MKHYKWGINATGNIANAMAEALGLVPDAELTAVASRTQQGADHFATRWAIPKVYSPYEAMLDDPDIDIVYVATPNALHKDNILSALAAGKHVLCEKPLTTSAADTIACAKAAREAGLFLMEAVWSAFVPAMQKARSLMAKNVIGTPRHLSANFISFRDPEIDPHLFDPRLGGGATLDLGVYPLSAAQILAGPIREISAQIVYGSSGVDEMVTVAALHENEVISNLSFGFRTEMPVAVKVTGDQGTLEIPQRFHHANQVIVNSGQTTEDMLLPLTGKGYAHEVMEVHSCLDTGRLESPVFPLSLSIRNAEIISSIRSG